MAIADQEFILLTAILNWKLQSLLKKIALEVPDEIGPVIQDALITYCLMAFCPILPCLPVLFLASLARTEKLYYCSSRRAPQKTSDWVWSQFFIFGSLIQEKEHNQLETKQMTL